MTNFLGFLELTKKDYCIRRELCFGYYLVHIILGRTH